MRNSRCLLVLIYLSFISMFSCVKSDYAKETRVTHEEGLKAFKSDFIRDKALPAVAVLTTTFPNKISMCSAFAFAKEGKVYKFASNAHCVLKEELENGRIKVFSTEMEISFYNAEGRRVGYFPATFVGALHEQSKKDFVIAEAEIDLLDVPVLKLSETDPVFGRCAFAVGFPADADSRVVLGFIYRLVSDDYQEVLLKVSGVRDSHGLSGSPVLDCRTKEVVAIIATGADEDPNVLGAFPISVFREAQKEIETKRLTYLKSIEAQ